VGRRRHGRSLIGVDLLAGPGLKPLWAAARRRVESNGLSLEGTPLVLRALSPEQADAIAGLLGVRRPADGLLRVSLVALDRSLRSSAVGAGLLDVLTELGGPLVDRPSVRATDQSARAQRWSDLNMHPALTGSRNLADWLTQIRTSGLARRLAGDDDTAAVSVALDVLATLDGVTRYLLPVLAADMTGDAHGLDRGRPAGTLAVHALTFLAGVPFPADAADWRRAWSEAGVACDDLSCDVLVLNLPGWPAEPLRLTLRQASAWEPSCPSDGAVFVCENPAVVAAAADELGAHCPTLVCVDGMPSTAALVIVSGLVGAGAVARYHGDFDWRGLGIAGVLARKIPELGPWRFEAADYRDAVAGGLGSVELSGHHATSPWDPHLGPAMDEAGMAVYEEQLLPSLLADLAGPHTPA